MNNQDKKQKRNLSIRFPLNLYKIVKKEQRKERIAFPLAVAAAIITILATSAIGKLIVENTSIFQLLAAGSHAPIPMLAAAKEALQILLGMLCIMPIVMIVIAILKDKNE